MAINQEAFEEIQIGHTVVLHDGRRWRVAGIGQNNSDRDESFTVEIEVEIGDGQEATFRFERDHGIVDENGLSSVMNHAGTNVVDSDD